MRTRWTKARTSERRCIRPEIRPRRAGREPKRALRGEQRVSRSLGFHRFYLRGHSAIRTCCLCRCLTRRANRSTRSKDCASAAKRESAVLLSGMQLASSLLRDSSFSLVARGLARDNSYAVELEQGTLLAQTRLFAAVSRRTSFFRVEITGKLNENLFSVRNPVQNTVIMQVEEERLRQPNFLFRDAGAGMPAVLGWNRSG